MLRRSESAPQSPSAQTKSQIQTAAADAYPKDAAKVESAKDWTLVSRSGLPGAGSWSHQYGDTGNTSNSHDHLVKGGLGVLWYGDPGPSQMVNRHEGAMAPLSVGGRMFIQGEDNIMAYDAYNGLFLWEKKNPGALRTGVFNNEDTSNLAATEDALFVCVDDHCTEYDAATGEVRRVHKIPKSDDGEQRAWAYIAVTDGKLFGTNTMRSELRRELRRRGRKVENATDGIFAIDLKSGEQVWTYRGQNIMHMTIAIADGRVHFIDSSITPEERDEFLREDKTELEKLTGKAREDAEKELKRRDLRLAVAVDANTGEQLWSMPVDVTDCSHLAIGGGQMTLMATDGNVVICGANANGHFWRQFLAGEFKQRRLLVLDAATGEKRWAKDADYRHRPIVVGQQIIAEPWAFDLHQRQGNHAVAPAHRRADEVDVLAARASLRSDFRLAQHAVFPQRLHRLLRPVRRQRHAALRRPAAGLLDQHACRLAAWWPFPRPSAGCVCLFSIASTVVLEPRTDRGSWGIYSDDGPKTPVKNLAVNFGAPATAAMSRDACGWPFPGPKRSAGWSTCSTSARSSTAAAATMRSTTSR